LKDEIHIEKVRAAQITNPRVTEAITISLFLYSV